MILRYFSRLLFALAFTAVAGLIPGLAQDAAKPAPSSQAQSAPQPLPDAPAAPKTPPAPAFAASSSSATPAGASFSSSAGTPRFWSGKDPNAQVTVMENTLLSVMNDEPISSRQTRQGAVLSFMLDQDVVVGGILIIPRGAILRGTVVESKRAGALSGSAEIVLQLTSLDMAGRSYPLYTYQFRVTGESKTRPMEAKVRDGVIVGALAGAVLTGSVNGETTAVGRLAGAGTGAAVGAGVGAAVSLASPGPILDFPAESEMDFFLAAPISVVPVTQREAARLSEGLHPGGPVLYVRGETP